MKKIVMIIASVSVLLALATFLFLSSTNIEKHNICNVDRVEYLVLRGSEAPFWIPLPLRTPITGCIYAQKTKAASPSTWDYSLPDSSPHHYLRLKSKDREIVIAINRLVTVGSDLRSRFHNPLSEIFTAVIKSELCSDVGDNSIASASGLKRDPVHLVPWFYLREDGSLLDLRESSVYIEMSALRTSPPDCGP